MKIQVAPANYIRTVVNLALLAMAHWRQMVTATNSLLGGEQAKPENTQQPSASLVLAVLT